MSNALSTELPRHLTNLKQNLHQRIIYGFSRKIRKWKSILTDFRYRYALLQKIKNVVLICEYIFDFLKKCVPITEQSQYRFARQPFIRCFLTFLTFVVKSLVKTCLYLYDRVTASASNLYQSFLYVSKYLLIRKNQLQENKKWRAFTNCALHCTEIRQSNINSCWVAGPIGQTNH